MRGLHRRLVGALLGFTLLGAIEGAEPRGSYKHVLVERRGNAVEVRLPLTDIGGKVRVKARVEGKPGEAVAPSRTELGTAHYLEWQIGYDTPEPDKPAMADGVKFLRKGKWKYGAELSKIVQEALRAGLIQSAELKAMREELPKLAARSIDETESILIQSAPALANGAGQAGFQRSLVSVPLLRLETPQGWVEIELKPKQRAVGLQPMLYVCLPFRTWRTESGQPRPAGPTEPRETVRFIFDRDSLPLLLGTIRGFGSASKQHAEDLGNILDAILERK